MKRLECFDGLRGLLAVYVMLGHMAPFAVVPDGISRALAHGGAAVDVFFILSGLVIVRSLEQGGFAARPFLIARAARIFPVYLLLFAAGVAAQTLPPALPAMPWVSPGSPAHGIWSHGFPLNWAAQIAAHLTMTHGLFPNGILPNVWVSFLGAAWSLSTEWQFYVLALILGWARIGTWRLAQVFFVLGAAGLIWNANVPEAWRFSRAFLPNKAHYFALGIASAGLIQDGSRVRYALMFTAVAILCAVSGSIEKILPPMLWTACLIVQLRPGRWSRPLRSDIIQWLGAVSYPIYLVNEPVQKAIGYVLAWYAAGNGTLFTILWLPAATLIPIGLAALIHRYVEVPAGKWGRTIR